MLTVELIAKKRDGLALTTEEIDFLVNSYTKGKIPDYQFSALLMAVYLRGMNETETAALTRAMLASGKVMDLSFISGSKIGKHSTGGVGDKTTMIITPIVSAAGIYVSQTSGRGLGHTGGTLDKLASIPGFTTELNKSQYRSVLKKTKAVYTGQSADVAPADKLIYALRDVTATVACKPLIVSSIMSKKLAEGTDGLVLDVKCGSGAFMRTQKDAEELARMLVSTAKAFDKKVIAYITDMSQPLGRYIGNWSEIYESILILKGEYVPNLSELCLYLAGAMIHLGGKAASVEEGIELANQLIISGKAFDVFLQQVKAQGGDTSFITNPEKAPVSKYRQSVVAGKAGYVSEIDTFELGMAAIELGAGRARKEDTIDFKAGIVFKKMIGDTVKKGEEIAIIETDRKAAIESVEKRILNAVAIGKEKVKRPKLIKKTLV